MRGEMNVLRSLRHVGYHGVAGATEMAAWMEIVDT